jgi:polyisoprenoid-binding protein YceI
MRALKLCFAALSPIFIAALSISQFGRTGPAPLSLSDRGQTAAAIATNESSSEGVISAADGGAEHYRLVASQSKFVAHALAGGLLWFKGHDHLVAVREFTGEAQLTPGSINPASLTIVAKADSLVETSSVFTEQQKRIIDKELRDIVLEPAKYPEITFRSTQVAGQGAGNQYDLKITGDLTLHGVTRQITIPTKVTLNGRELRATGEFSIDRGDFKVKATSAFHGLVRVRDKVRFTFDIVGRQV